MLVQPHSTLVPGPTERLFDNLRSHFANTDFPPTVKLLLHHTLLVATNKIPRYSKDCHFIRFVTLVFTWGSILAFVHNTCCPYGVSIIYVINRRPSHPHGYWLGSLTFTNNIWASFRHQQKSTMQYQILNHQRSWWKSIKSDKQKS